MTAAMHAACDRPLAETSPHVTRVQRPRLVLATCVLASSLAFVDGSVVNVGLREIGSDLGAGPATLQWIVNAYLLPLSALLMLGGAAGDRFGRRRLLILGTALFAVASLICAVAPGTATLLGGRLLQGMGAALLMPNSLSVLGSSFSGEEKGRAIGIWAASGAAMGALGPVLGGWLIDTVGWRGVFLINLPLAAGALVLAWRFVPTDDDRPDRSMDTAGAALVTIALAATTFSLTLGSGPSGWTDLAVAAGVAGLAALVAFVLVEHRKADHAMMPLTLFTSSTFVGLSLVTGLLYAALGGLMVVLPYLLISVAGYSGTQAGAALVPLPLVLAISSPTMGALASRVGPRLPLSVGPLVVAAGFALTLRIDDQGLYWSQVLPAILIIALGMSGAVAPLTTAVLGSVDDRHAGSASGFNSAVARTGGLIATALVGSVLATRGDLLVDRLHGTALVGACVCLLAGLSAVTLVRQR